MSGVVSKLASVLVRPWEAVEMADRVQLCPYDKLFVGMSPTALLVFSDPMEHAAERIKTAVSHALVHFHVLAGRLFLDDEYISCTSDGVSFVAATAASLTIKDIGFTTSSLIPATATTLLDELAVYYPAQGCGSSDPLLLMQVTEFSCGGFVVGVTWNHAVADGAGMGHFLLCVGELARGLSAPSIVPVACDDSLNVGPPMVGELLRFFGSHVLAPYHELALLHITISSNLINCVRDAASSGSRRCTAFEAVTAVLWKCRTRAIMSDPDAPTALAFPVDMRSYVGAKNAYYRNCTVGHLAMAKCGLVAHGHIIDLVKLIQHAKDQIPHSMQMQHLELEQHEVQSYHLCVATYWRNLGFEDADFGGGKAAKVLSYRWREDRVGIPSNIITSGGKDAGDWNVMSLAVKKEHAHTFLHELARFTAI